MNKLNPVLKKLLVVAGRCEQSSPQERNLHPSRALVTRVLRISTTPSAPAQLSLLELMVQRAAGISATIAIAIIALQLWASESTIGVLHHALSDGAMLFHAFLP